MPSLPRPEEQKQYPIVKAHNPAPPTPKDDDKTITLKDFWSQRKASFVQLKEWEDERR